MTEKDLIKRMRTEGPEYRTYTLWLSDTIVATVVTDRGGSVATSAVAALTSGEQMQPLAAQLLREVGAEGDDLIASEFIDLRDEMMEAFEFILDRTLGRFATPALTTCDSAVH